MLPYDYSQLGLILDMIGAVFVAAPLIHIKSVFEGINRKMGQIIEETKYTEKHSDDDIKRLELSRIKQIQRVLRHHIRERITQERNGQYVMLVGVILLVTGFSFQLYGNYLQVEMPIG